VKFRGIVRLWLESARITVLGGFQESWRTFISSRQAGVTFANVDDECFRLVCCMVEPCPLHDPNSQINLCDSLAGIMACYRDPDIREISPQTHRRCGSCIHVVAFLIHAACAALFDQIHGQNRPRNAMQLLTGAYNVNA
jgi:hypothetical protein